MAEEKIDFEQFLKSVDINNQDFIQSLHDYLMGNKCKVAFEEKKSGLLASYKDAKTKKALLNLLFRKQGMLVRIYGQNANSYLDFLNTLPEEMVHSINTASECKRLVHNTCSPKCSGYDVVIKDERYQKCRYSAFEFLITEESKSPIKTFIESELQERTTA